jgi:hypothetical protein
MKGFNMPSYEYYLIEKTVLSVVIDAEDKDQADQQVEDMLYQSDIDWGMGDMETSFEFNGEIT